METVKYLTLRRRLAFLAVDILGDKYPNITIVGKNREIYF